MTTNSTTLGAPNGFKCLIATATYGSELSPEVELLRGFRDNSLAKSRVGSSFLVVFNAWYYSFSPSVAGFISAHEIVRPAMKVLLYPLIGFLSLASQLYAQLSAYPEWAALVSGLLACSLIGGFYIGLPVGLVARRRLVRCKLNATALTILFLASIAMILIGEVTLSTGLLMISSTLAALSALAVSGLAVAKAASRILTVPHSRRWFRLRNCLVRLWTA
jgi:peptide/nickel transport system substrate-binding protein